jgi:uncharacterized membrane-anchored protein
MLAMIGAGRKGGAWVALALATLVCAGAVYGQERERPRRQLDVKWQTGPCAGKLGGQAQIQVPAGYRFLPEGEAAKFLEALDNICDGDEFGVLAPKDDDWFLVFEFDDVGYVKDDEKEKLDADAMLKQIKDSDKPQNDERRKRGMDPIHTIGWRKKPAYNEKTNNLEWALRLKSNGPEFINHNTKILGRHGVMVVTWVGDPEDMDTAMPKCEKLLSNFAYTSGNKYAEFKRGDKIAQYGLTALITGGTAAVLLKTGLLQRFWKLIVLGVVAIGGAIGKFFKKIFGRKAEA